ncbi:hypothetical protein NL676_001090 [Syzygium grande]|nr:hypothetical protein NL676_001090 [Syzygium grande]
MPHPAIIRLQKVDTKWALNATVNHSIPFPNSSLGFIRKFTTVAPTTGDRQPIQARLPGAVTRLPGATQVRLPGATQARLPGAVQARLPGAVARLPGATQARLPSATEAVSASSRRFPARRVSLVLTPRLKF